MASTGEANDCHVRETNLIDWLGNLTRHCIAKEGPQIKYAAQPTHGAKLLSGSMVWSVENGDGRLDWWWSRVFV